MDEKLREREVHELEAYEEALAESSFSDDSLVIPDRVVRRYATPYRENKLPVDLLFKVLGPLSQLEVLDCGCGDGEFSVIMALLGASVTGIDISERLIEVAGRRADLNRIRNNARFLCGSIHDLPFEEGSFDLVFGKGVLHHVDIGRAAVEIERVLKIGGRAVFEEPISFSPLLRRMRKNRLVRTLVRENRITPDEEPLYESDRAVLAERFAEVRVYETQILARLERIFKSERALRSLNSLDTRLMERYPALRRFGRLAVFECRK